METFCLPIHEINERFTKSELFIVAWRSQEQHNHMKKRMAKPEGSGQGEYVVSRRRYGANDILPDNLPEKFFNEEGEVDLSRVTGSEARKYMAAVGIHFPEIRPVRR